MVTIKLVINKKSLKKDCPVPLSRYRFKVEILIIVNKLFWGHISQRRMWSIKVIRVPPQRRPPYVQILLNIFDGFEIFQVQTLTPLRTI
jgi:hypothetical protein